MISSLAYKFVTNCNLVGLALALLVCPTRSLAHGFSPAIEGAIYAASQAYDIRPELIRAIIQVESSGRIYAVGSHGERGLMQINPRYYPEASFDVYENVMLGTKLLAYWKEALQGRYGDAWFIGYNVGYADIINPYLFSYYLKVKEAQNVTSL